MFKKESILILTVIFLSVATGAIGAPLPGIWNGDTTGFGSAFDGKYIFLDPGNDGTTIGDIAKAQDNTNDLFVGYGNCWYMDGLERDWFWSGVVVDIGSGTGIMEVATTRRNGTFFIRGGNLWGQDAETIYTASIQGAVEGMYYFTYNSDLENWEWDHFEGTLHWWGNFNEDEYLFDLTSQLEVDYRVNLDGFGNVAGGTMTDVTIRIEPVPEPATMLLFGTGLMGLACSRTRRKRKS